MFLSGTTAFGGTIYNNTILSGAVSGLTGSDRTIQIDDVLVPDSRNPAHLPLAINSITLDLAATPRGQRCVQHLPLSCSERWHTGSESCPD
jgi:hypothetical protein